ncbi:MAG: ferrous iron transport protein B [Desulfovibrionaceae bacterium]
MTDDLTLALAGNPNSGKTTLFNKITGARQHVGNYPGITVEKKEGVATCNGRILHIIDLPGTYSLTAYTQEEIVARNVLAMERPDAAIAVLNAGALERNLYLAVQLMEMGVPTVLALNMMDEAEKEGLRIDAGRLEALLGLPAVPTVARSGRGVDTLLCKASAFAQARRDEIWVPLVLSYGPDLDPVLGKMAAMIQAAHFLTDRYPARWTALKYLENDHEIMELGRLACRESRDAALPPVFSEELEAQVKEVADHLQATLDTYPEAVIADYRYGFITSLLRQGVLTREPLHDRIALSDKLDKVLTHQFCGPIIMFAVLFLVYQITFVIGDYPLGWVGAFFGWLSDTMAAILPDGMLRSLVVSGMIDGVGGVLSFVPLILLIFMQIAFLEDSGYMARIAYMLDRVFRIFGLHGCSVMPLIVSGGIGGGCAVPGVLASRTLRSRREKLATLLTAPFMTCGAKLPVFILLVGVFFPGHEAVALFLITMVAWAMALLVAKLLRSTIIKGPSTPFVMELPPYRLPTLRGLCIHTWERTWQYIKKAGTVILAISILLWVLMTFPQLPAGRVSHFADLRAPLETSLEAATAANDQVAMDAARARLEALDNAEGEEALVHSVAGRIGTSLEPVSRWAGFDWRTNIALVGGFAAKEVIISTLGTAYSLGEVDPEETVSLADHLRGDPTWNPVRASALILFILLYAPCFVTVAVIRQEAGSWGWAIFSTVFNTTLAFALAVAVFQIGSV